MTLIPASVSVTKIPHDTLKIEAPYEDHSRQPGQIHYTFKTKEGELIDQSEKDDPFSFVFGKDEMIDGIEKALRGREQESLHIELSPADAYGEHDPELQQTLSKKHIEGLEEVEVSMQLQSETEMEKPSRLRLWTSLRTRLQLIRTIN